jgi:hypothetical protein
MLRPIFSYVLTSLVLLSQVGLPMHYHYCKGSLESVSIFFRNNCDDEVATAKLKDCCNKLYQKHCTKQNNGCCHDRVEVINQDLTSVLPVFHVLIPFDLESNVQGAFTSATELFSSFPISFQKIVSDAGPPIYIRFHSLIYYS